MSKKPLKIYVHSYVSISLPAKNAQKLKRFSLRKFLSGLFHLFFDFSYLIGIGIIKSFVYLGHAAITACLWPVKITKITYSIILNELRITDEFLAKRSKLMFSPQFAKSIASFLIITGLGALGFESMHLIAKGLEIKGKVLGVATLGSQYLDEAKDAFEKQDFEKADNKFLIAYKSFSTGQKELESTKTSVYKLLDIIPQKRDAEKMLKAATLVSQSGQFMVDFYQKFSQIKISGEGLSSADPTDEVLESLYDSTQKISRNVSEADKILSEINPDNMPAGGRQDFLDIKQKVKILNQAFYNFKDVFNLVKNTSLGKKNVLVLFENNNELRPAGGFIGTFGNLVINNGKITNIHVSSVYDLDGQLREKITPPSPLLNVNDRWYLRDANWFADFPESARKVSNFYEKEGGETPDLVIAMTPSLIIDLLKITGPITLPKYNISLDADNFVEQTQVASSVTAQETNPDAPKQVLADFVPALMQKLSDIGPKAGLSVLEALQSGLNGKQLAIYSRDGSLQKQLQSFHWTGEVLDTDRDYLSVVSANLGGTKTDLYIDQQIDLSSTVNEQGEVFNQLTITRTNRMPKLDNTQNTGFIRIFVPEGSTLISNIGFDYKNLDAQALKGYKTDSAAYEWEKNLVKDMVTGTLIGKEAGKTFFGNWLTVNGGETKTIKLAYKLPFKLKDIDKHSLVLQKQIGGLDQKITYRLGFPGRHLEWKNFSTDTLETSSLSTSIVLNKDYFVGMVFSKTHE